MRKNSMDCMTSELLFQFLNGEPDYKDFYLSEYEKRLKSLNLADNQIAKFRELDENAIEKGCNIKLNSLLAANPLIQPTMTENSINVKNCTMSELVYLTVDANNAFDNSPYWANTPAWNLVCKHTFYGPTHESTYELREKLGKIGLSLEQIELFNTNECKLINRLRWKSTYETL